MVLDCCLACCQEEFNKGGMEHAEVDFCILPARLPVLRDIHYLENHAGQNCPQLLVQGALRRDRGAPGLTRTRLFICQGEVLSP